MENFSKNTKRGRPRVISEEELALAQWMTDRDKTPRHLHNVIYRTRAIAVLARDPAYSWVADGPAMEKGEARSWKRTILAELGRIADPDTMRAVASELCKKRPKTKEAVLMVRRFRTGKSPKPNALSLAAALEQTVNEYFQSHPGMTLQKVRQALLFVAEEIEEQIAAEAT